MPCNLKKTLNDFLPPALSRFLRPRIRFQGAYGSWSEARAVAAGYDAPDILEKVSAATDDVLTGRAAFERDSIAFKDQEFNWPLISTLLLAARKTNGGRALKILDFGGSLGSSYFQNRKALPSDLPLKWMVVEQPAFVARGRERFANAELSFHDSIAECDAPEAALLCSVLPYLPEPWRMLDDVLRQKPEFILIDRTPLLQDGERDRLCMQHVPKCICKASYPAWILRKKTLLDVLSKDYKIDALFTTGRFPLENPCAQADETCLLCERKNVAEG